jgi:signal transduction histidine kinase
MHALDRTHNRAIARRGWGLASLGIALVGLAFTRASAADEVEALWLRNIVAIDVAQSVTFLALFLCALVEFRFAQFVTRYTGPLGIGALLVGYALLGANAQRVTGTVVYYLGAVVVTPVLVRVRTPVFAATALCSAAILVAGIVTLQRSPSLRTTNLALVVAITAYAIVNSRIVRASAARDVAQRHALQRFNDELSANVDEKTRDLRALAARLDEIIETERRQIARELHDDLGQELTALRLEIEALRPNVRAADALDRMTAGVHRAHLAVRTILESLRPRLLDEEGLRAAILWLVARLEERTGCEVRADLEEVDVDVAVALAAFRVAQEALTNVARHSQATRVTVTLVGDREGVTLTIHDNGVRREGPITPGRGLTGMRERTWDVGGELTISAPAEGGTIVVARFPLSARAHDVPRRA